MFDNGIFNSYDTSFDSLPEPTGYPLEAHACERSVFPNAILDMSPGPELAAFLSAVDPAELSGHDAIGVLRAHHRLISHFQAKFYADVAALSDVMFDLDGDWEMADHATAMELRAALRLTRRMAEIEIEFARELAERLPVVADVLESGQIDVRRARILIDGTVHLSETNARQVVDQVIDRAGELTTGELRARVAKLCISVDPGEAQHRYETAIDRRMMISEPTLDGTANISLTDIAPDRAAQAMARINHLANGLKVEGETRTMDQIRADIAVDLLCGEHHHDAAKAATVNVNVDLATLAHLNDDPGELAGYGPVVADIARRIADISLGAGWRFRVTDPETGQPLLSGVTKARRHTTEQRRQVELRDQVCAFPGCRMPATDCDIDHIEPWVESGTTSVAESAPVCRHDHAGRHSFGWTYQPISGGDYLWQSRLGLHYTKSGRPPPEWI